MPQLRVGVVLPYFLRLTEGDYPTAPGGEAISVAAPLLSETTTPRNPVSAQFSVEDSADEVEIDQRRTKCADRLVDRINRLVRWYRATSRRPEVLEVTRVQVSPFVFEVLGGGAPAAWSAPLAHPLPTTQPSPREAGGLWERLSASYRKRNASIHAGDNATEADAEQAIAVAGQLVQIMSQV